MNVQAVRVLDVLVLGPFLVLLAVRERRLTDGERLALGVIGLGTVLYNWRGLTDE